MGAFLYAFLHGRGFLQSTYEEGRIGEEFHFWSIGPEVVLGYAVGIDIRRSLSGRHRSTVFLPKEVVTLGVSC